MPTIQTYDPLGTATEAVGSYLGAKKQNQQSAAAALYQQQRDKRADAVADRDYALKQQQFGLDQQKAGDAHAAAQAGLQTVALNQAKVRLENTIAQAKFAHDKEMYPVEYAYKKAQAKVEQGQAITAADKHALDTYKLKAEQTAQKYQLPMLQAKLQEVQAHISQIGAETSRAYAGANAENARAYREMHPITAAPKPSSQEREQTAYNTAYNALSEKGQQFFDMLANTNNPPTRLQAMAALRQSRISPLDKRNMFTLIESKDTPFETQAQQQGQERFETRRTDTKARQAFTDQRSETRYAHATAEQAFHDVAKSKKYNALSPEMKEAVRTAMVGSNMSVGDLLSHLDEAPYSSDQKAQIRAALTQ